MVLSAAAYQVNSAWGENGPILDRRWLLEAHRRNPVTQRAGCRMRRASDRIAAQKTGGGTD